MSGVENFGCLSIERASQVDPRVPNWLWMGRIPQGMLSVIAGQPSGGKSLFSIYLSAQVSRAGSGADTILSAPEDPLHETIRPRLGAAGAKLDRVHLMRGLSLPSGIGRLEQMVDERHAALVVIDPVASHLDRGINRTSDSIRLATDPLTEMAERTGAAVVMVEHTLKFPAKNAHALASIGGGSSGLRAAARMAFIGGKDPDDDERVVLCCVKHVSERPKPLAFTLDGATYEGTDGRNGTAGLLVFAEELDEYDVMRLLVKPGQDGRGRPADKRAFAAQWLAQYLYGRAAHEAPTNEIKEDARQYGITSKTLDRAAADMEIMKVKRKGDDGKQAWWWLLPPGLVHQMDEEADDD